MKVLSNKHDFDSSELRRLGEYLVTSIDGEDPTQNEGGTYTGQNTLENLSTVATTLVDDSTNDSSDSYNLISMQTNSTREDDIDNEQNKTSSLVNLREIAETHDDQIMDGQKNVKMIPRGNPITGFHSLCYFKQDFGKSD